MLNDAMAEIYDNYHHQFQMQAIRYVTLMLFLQLDFAPITPMAIGRWYAQACSFAYRQLVLKAQRSRVDEFYIAAFNQYIFMGSQRLNQMGMKRKAPGDDKLKPDEYQCMDAKSPDAVEANEAKTKANMEVRPEAIARGDTIMVDLEEAIEAAGSSKKGVFMQLDCRPTDCHNMQTIQQNPKLTHFGVDGNIILLSTGGLPPKPRYDICDWSKGAQHGVND
uniref:Uncharacterized protein n=1 Tax=Romanomermis culicivorax TaxID=13658 RepID=A0A915L7Z1_ROMCU